MKKISIIIPAYNEEQPLRLLYDELVKTITLYPELRYEWEILFINDGSRDGTLSVIKDLREIDKRVCYVDLSRNFGKEAAMCAGFDYATGDCAIIMDADLQHPPQVMMEMLKFWEEGYEDVYGKRNTRGDESWLRKCLSKLYYRVLQKATRIEILENVGDFRLLDRKCIEALKQLRETERYTKGMYAWIGFRKKEIIFDTANRIAGKSSWTFYRLVHLAIDGITSYSTFPLRISTIIGTIVSVIAFIYLIFIFIKTIIYGDPI